MAETTGGSMRCAAAAMMCLAACVAPGAVTTSPNHNEHTPCAEARADVPACRADSSDITEAVARATLGDREFAIVRDNLDHLTFYARASVEEATLCCSLSAPMARIGQSDLFVARYRLDRLDEASLSFIPPAWFADGRSFRTEDILLWAGPNAPAPSSEVAQLRGERLERALWSEHLQETRRIFVYLPPNYDRSRQYPGLFMADGAGAMVLAPMIEGLIVDGAIAAIVVIGAGSGQSGIVEDRSSLGISDLRSADYLPGFRGGGDRYEQHLRFFSEELVTYAVEEFNIALDPTRRAVTGFSNGGSFSVFAALRRPDVFGISIPLSPSWRLLEDEDFSQPQRARFFMSAGLYEMARHSRARTHAESLRSRGYEVVFDAPVMGHDRAQETLMLSRYLPLAFPPG
jgi:enterochelin esterase-like enzyme